ncbi:YraN family protein [Dechloromonas sp. ZY10]|uniref:YraN family protein n=1 Tax=Dechloromonas aquae TaxID=2664436 RepID=UPI003528B9AC
MRRSGNDTTVAKGREAETAAARLLEKAGLRIVDRNFRVRGGEIDLIARDGATLVFVEVRARSGSGFGGAAASIDAAKQQRLLLAARHYLARHGECDCRFDCLLYEAGHWRWLRGAFAADG